MSIIRVFLADDHPVIREGVATVIQAQQDLAFVGFSSSAAELAEHRPGGWDVLVLDLSLSGWDDAELVAAAKKANPRGRVLIYTQLAEGPRALRALKVGADGFLSKSRPVSDLLTAIRTVHAEGKFVTGTLGAMLVDETMNPHQAPHDALSGREMAVLVRLARGVRQSSIAGELGIQPSTISTHLKSIRQKLNLESNGELVRYALEHKLIR
ncbi:MAG: response regulator transcription factor [Polyangiaceae bacterium]